MANEFKVKKGLIVDGSNTVLDIQGTQGQLFSVTDSLTGDLFSVSDVSGIPILNVNSSGLSTFDGDVKIDGAVEITSSDNDTILTIANTKSGGQTWKIHSSSSSSAPAIASGDFLIRNGSTNVLRLGGNNNYKANFAGNVAVNNLELPDGHDIGWDGGFSSSKPTLAANGTTMKMYPSGNAAVAQFTLSPSAATFAGTVTTQTSTVSSGGASLIAYGYDGAALLYTTRAESNFNTALYLYNNPTSGAGTGTGIMFRAKSDTTAGQQQATIYSSWTTNTHASRTAKLVFQTANSGVVADKLTIEGNGDATFTGNVSTAVEKRISIGTWDNSAFTSGNAYGYYVSSGTPMLILEESDQSKTGYVGVSGGNMYVGGVVTSLILQSGSGSTALTIDSSQNATFTGNVTAVNVIPTTALRIGAADKWKIRGNNSNDNLAFEYAASETLADTNIKLELTSTAATFAGNLALGGSTLQAYHANVTSVLALKDQANIFTRANETYIGQNFYYGTGDSGRSIEIGKSTLMRLRRGEINMYFGGANDTAANTSISLSEKFTFTDTGNFTAQNNITVTGNLIGKSDHTTEVGSYSSGQIKRIRMSQGGEVVFGDSTTANPIGLTEGVWDAFSDQDYMSIYARNNFRMYGYGTSASPALHMYIGRHTSSGGSFMHLGGGTSPNGTYGVSNTILTVKGTTSGGEGIIQIVGLGNNATDNVGCLAFHSQAEADPMASIRSVRGSGDDVGSLTFNTNNGGTESVALTLANDNTATFTGVIHTTKDGGAVAAISTPRIRLRTDGVIEWGATYNAGTLTWDTNKAIIAAQAGNALELKANNSTLGLTIATSGAATFAGSLSVTGKAIVGGVSSRSTLGLTAGYSSTTAFVEDSDATDTNRTISIVNEANNSTNSYATLGFRISPSTTTSMGDLKFVRTGADENSLIWCPKHGSTFHDRLTIKSDGNVAIKGTDVAVGGTVLDIQGSQGQLFSVTNSLTGDLFSVSDVSGVPIFNVNASGAVDVDGTFTSSGDVVAYSDERLKTNIETLDGSKVYDMRGVSFNKDNKEGSGVIAQELEKIAPELVNNDSQFKAVAYGNITGYLIEAIKDLKAEIEELKSNKCNCNK